MSLLTESYLFRILVPCKFEDTQKPVSIRHHRQWDKYVLSISNGLTIMKPTTKGVWRGADGQLYYDRVIPVEIYCTEKEIRKIAEFTKNHYRQIAVMYCRMSNDVHFV